MQSGHLAKGSRVREKLAGIYPCALIVLFGIYCHGFILTNDGTYWDGWYWLYWLSHRDWPPMIEYTSAQGLPFSLWVYAPLALAPNIVTTGMWANFICLTLQGLVIHQLALRLAGMPRGEALLLTLLFQAMPMFTGAQDFPMLNLIFYHLLFLGAALLATLSLECGGVRHGILRGLALLGFFLSCATNGALIVFYGGLYLLLLLHYRRCQNASLPSATRHFLTSYPDYFLVPPVVFASRLWLIPQFGWYENYNRPGSNQNRFIENVASFFKNVLPYHARNLGAWFTSHPLASATIVLFVILSVALLPGRWRVSLGPLSSRKVFFFGLLLLALSIFPLAWGDKHFPEDPTGEFSTWCMLTALPLSILLYSVLRMACPGRGERCSRVLAPVVAGFILILGSEFTRIYVTQRAEWVLNRSVLHQASKDAVIRDSSVILLQSCNFSVQIITGTYAFATHFGDLTRLVTSIAPDRPFYNPGFIRTLLARTTVLPNEFNRIDPSGQQAFLQVEPSPACDDEWNLVRQYLTLRFFAPSKEMDRFLASLCTLKTTVMKQASPLVPGKIPDAGVETASKGIPTGNFTNGAGMQMVRLPDGWWAGKYETTQDQYQKLMGKNPSLFRDPVRPVECVSWNDADAFCERLTLLEGGKGRLPPGYAYRLPTVAEFDRMSDGGSLLNAVTAVYFSNWHTAPVGFLPSNSLGLHDVIGNVWEWCQEWRDDHHRFKVSKGGSWVEDEILLTILPIETKDLDWNGLALLKRMVGEYRYDYPDQGFWNHGFRCVLAPEKFTPAAPLKGK